VHAALDPLRRGEHVRMGHRRHRPTLISIIPP
jgi:hypothetical protein